MYQHTGDTKYNPQLMDGDIIDVPYEDVLVTIAGPVKRPGQFELVGSKDLNELLGLADGFRTTATGLLPLRIVRRNSKSETTETVVVPYDPRSASLPNVPLRPDDHVQVPSAKELQTSITLIGAIAGATAADEATSVRRMPFVEGDTVRALIERAGGIGAGADLAGSYVRRRSGEIIKLDLEALILRREFSADKPIQMADTLVVPYKRRGVLVEGAVMRPGVIQFNPVFSTNEYVANAGGASRYAQSPNNYRVITPDGKTPPNSKRLIINSGDTIVVPERNFTRSEIVQLVMGGAALLVSSVSLVILVTR